MTTDPLLSLFRGIAEELLGDVDWQDAGKGFCPCPGLALHSGSSAKRDCTVFVGEDRAPSVFCVHTSCAGAVAEKNRLLRSRCGKAKWAAEHGGEVAAVRPKRRRLTAAERARIERKNFLANRARKAATALPAIVRRFAWAPAEMLQHSPAVLGPADDHWRLLLSLYLPGDVLWIAGKKDSGKLRHARFFRTAADWLTETLPPLGPLIAASTFVPRCCQRAKDRVVRSPFLVVESDTLSRDEIGGVFRYLRDREGLPLLAVIDTAGRSLHGWFERPADAARNEELLTILPALGCDPGPLREPCMSRLPGAWRGTQQQRLLYFHPPTRQ